MRRYWLAILRAMLFSGGAAVSHSCVAQDCVLGAYMYSRGDIDAAWIAWRATASDFSYVSQLNSVQACYERYSEGNDDISGTQALERDAKRSAHAAFMLAVYRFHHRGLNDHKTEELLEFAAARGVADAVTMQGIIAEEAMPTKPEFALRKYSIGAQLNSLFSKWALSKAYSQGTLGVIKNAHKARYWCDQVKDQARLDFMFSNTRRDINCPAKE